MDISLIIGIALGCIAVIGGMIFKGASLSVLINPAAFLIIIVGTVAAIANAFPLQELKRIPALFRVLFVDKQQYSPAEVINLIVEFSQKARKEGLLSLESNLDDLEDPFIRKGLQLIVDGANEEYLRQYLETEIQMMQERHAAGAAVFSQAGTYAPTLGVLGAVVGLIGALGNMENSDQIGASIASAFVATLLGIFTGYVLWHPFANKLRRKSEREVQIKTMILEGLLLLQVGGNPMQIKEKMMAFLPQEERLKIEEQEQLQRESTI